MNRAIIKPKTGINGIFTVPGDKSISHRAVMLSAIASGKSTIKGFLMGEDCLSTIRCFRQLGVKIDVDESSVTVYGGGLDSLKQPESVLDVGNSGTTIRLLSGLLSQTNLKCTLTGDSSIQKRPMGRVIEPLTLMGGNIRCIEKQGFAPFEIIGRKLKGISYRLPVASAQIKSAIILAALSAEGETVVDEPVKCRDHTEIMLSYLGADIKKDGSRIIINPVKSLAAKDITVPADISSAAFLIVAAMITKDSHIVIKNVGINETRTGIIDALSEMGGQIKINNKRQICGEYVGDIEVKSSQLEAISIGGDIIPRMIDEIPVFAVAALFADGNTQIKNAEELKVKESNRIKTMTEELSRLGANVKETHDGMIICGSRNTLLKGNEVNSHNDHRVAMSLAVAGLKAEGETIIFDSGCVDISFPGFFEQILKSIDINI